MGNPTQGTSGTKAEGGAGTTPGNPAAVGGEEEYYDVLSQYGTAGNQRPRLEVLGANTVKFVLASLYVESGLQEINTLLTAMVEGHYQPDPAAVCDVISLHGELSRTFGLLTKVMSAELVLVMASGTIACVTILLTVVSSVTMGAFGDMALMVALYLMMASVTMVLPSEAVHRCLEAAGEARELLLAAELRQPRLSLQLGLLRESVSRDLDTLGELGLFRLRRSTVLSIGATILTNAIIMLQFYFA
ncbi:hypothetical protein FJT64_006952 [Amphibalanus amphitrite]|uniref:Gustatory receptor n=1 Tax=Amphibalanus amphitrite TaxID=1232801 RepID=A0A6A4VVW4_AMPAM|nr:hypothetical protein FJT64_006952 [Amphibalanus amphitrite]